INAQDANPTNVAGVIPEPFNPTHTIIGIKIKQSLPNNQALIFLDVIFCSKALALTIPRT
ncbi:MAG: hypothetical protein U9O94_04215, partial [Nanoarchaeota archaeon]|nr:hypothetical protein [Nanoarchaeota archaeon]